MEKNESVPLMGKLYYNRYDPDFFTTQEQLIKSQNVSRKVVKILELEKTYEIYFPETKEKEYFFTKNILHGIKEWSKGILTAWDNQESDHIVKERPWIDVLADSIQKNITVTPVRKAD